MVLWLEPRRAPLRVVLRLLRLPLLPEQAEVRVPQCQKISYPLVLVLSVQTPVLRGRRSLSGRMVSLWRRLRAQRGSRLYRPDRAPVVSPWSSMTPARMI